MADYCCQRPNTLEIIVAFEWDSEYRIVPRAFDMARRRANYLMTQGGLPGGLREADICN